MNIKQSGLFSNIKVIQPKQSTNKALLQKVKSPKKTKKIGKSVQTLENLYNVTMVEYRAKLKRVRPQYKFELITTKERLQEYLQHSLSVGELAFDTETSGVDEMNDPICGLCIYTPGENPAYVPVAHLDYEHNVDADFFVEAIIEASQNGKLKIIMANAKFDTRVISNSYDFKAYLKTFWDVILAAKFLNENLKSKALKFLWEFYVQGNKNVVVQDLDNYKKLFGNLKYNTLDPEKVYPYAAMDGLETYEVYEFQKPYLTPGSPKAIEYDLNEAAELYIDEVALMEIVAEMEDTGIYLDVVQGHSLEVIYQKRLDDCVIKFNNHVDAIAPTYLHPLKQQRPELFAKLDNPLNPGSTQQLAILFYDAMGMKNKGKKKRSTDEESLEYLVHRYPQHKALFDPLLEYRGTSKQLNTYIKKLQRVINPKTGRLHGKYNIYGADTGRMSSKDPNLQNIPKYTGVRKMFAATPGYVMIGCDYSQQEPRLLAYLCGDESMKEAYRQGKDLYSQMAVDLFGGTYTDYIKAEEATQLGVTYNKAGEKKRDSVKSILLGILYGRGVNSIAEEVGISKDEAKNIKVLFYQKFPKIKVYEDTQKQFCYDNGYVKTIRGRKRRLTDLQLPKFYIGENANQATRNMIMNKLTTTWDRGEKNRLIKQWKESLGVSVIDNSGYIARAERQVLNAIIQGSAGDMTKLAMILFHKSKRMREMGGRMLLLLHDEIIIEVPEQHAKEASDLLAELMIKAADMLMDVPVKSDSEIFACWEGEPIYV